MLFFSSQSKSNCLVGSLATQNVHHMFREIGNGGHQEDTKYHKKDKTLHSKRH